MTGQKSYTALTHREKQILACLMDGMSYKEIAQKDTVSLATVRTQVLSLFTKKGVNSLPQLLVKEYKALLARPDLVEGFKRLQKQIYQQMAEKIQKKIKEVENV